MTIVRHPGHQPADLAAAVHDAAESLAALWIRSSYGVAHRVSASQLRALVVMQRRGALNLTQLAEELGAMLSSASRLCDRLVAAGLIERRASAHSRRELLLELTRDGRGLLDDLAEQRRRDIAGVLERMEPTAQDALLEGLTEFAEAVAGAQPQPTPRQTTG